jgi:hypothetical protein
MKLPIDDPLRERFSQVRETQLAEYRGGQPQVVDEVFLEEEVVRLTCGGGHSAYIGFDGRVIVVNYNEGFPPVLLEDSKHIASVIVRWASEAGLPELVGLLPLIPDGGEICSLCGGDRYERWEERSWCCRRCGGLGWTP